MNPHFLNKRLSHQLGFAGLLPFFLLMLGVWLADVSWLGDFLRGQKAYAMVILSFLDKILVLGSSASLAVMNTSFLIRFLPIMCCHSSKFLAQQK